jgi:hypothetical protein
MIVKTPVLLVFNYILLIVLGLKSRMRYVVSIITGKITGNDAVILP